MGLVSVARMKNQLAVVCAAVVAVSSCTPRTGPSDDDDGSMLFWLVAGDAKVTIGEACTDNEGMSDSYAPLTFERDTYLTYRVQGSTAVLTTCERFSASSCTDYAPEILFEIDGNTLVGSPPRQSDVLDGRDCTLHLDQEWRVDDNGESGLLAVSVTISLEGDGCFQFEQQVAADSPNGKGLDGCVIAQEMPLEFDAAR